ncbi:hypothetical protein SBA4_2470041 [Candidatus Sulfopaludibacter sp. SbA4]|nr:hypothetical protein SBA4_2470041 [Candidatus Sulfopaludibacter sp. SbA4]
MPALHIKVQSVTVASRLPVSDIKLFQIGPKEVQEIPGRSVAIEKSLQVLIERHLDAFLSVRFLASEYSTGKAYGGRIDTLGIDENGSPVIIEYKRALNRTSSTRACFIWIGFLITRVSSPCLCRSNWVRRSQTRLNGRARAYFASRAISPSTMSTRFSRSIETSN